MQNLQPFEEIHIPEPPAVEPYEKFRGAGVYADLLLDHTFKKAFDPDTQNKACLVELLNAVLEGEIESPIADVKSRDKEVRNGSNENRVSVFDLHCTDERNRRFIVEVQIAKQENIVNRAIFYAAQDIVAQGERGVGYRYSLDPVVTVVFMEFECFGDGRFLRTARLREGDGTDVSRTLLFAFVELPKFKKTEGELESTLDRGLFALKNIKRLREMPESYAGTPFELLFSVSKLSRLTKEEQKMIDLEQKRKWDEYAIRDYAVKTGIEEGRKEGIKEGIKEGLEKGRAEGRKVGERKASFKIAKALIEKGISPEIVQSTTGLSAEELRELT